MTELHPQTHAVRLKLQETYPGLASELGVGVLSELLSALDEIEEARKPLRLFRLEAGDGSGPWWSLSGEERRPEALAGAPVAQLPMPRLSGFETGDGRVWTSATTDLAFLASRLTAADFPHLGRAGFGVSVYEAPRDAVRVVDDHVVFERNRATLVERRSAYFARGRA